MGPPRTRLALAIAALICARKGRAAPRQPPAEGGDATTGVAPPSDSGAARVEHLGVRKAVQYAFDGGYLHWLDEAGELRRAPVR
jgi:hypothetical protein